MDHIPMCHSGSRQLQDRFATRVLADRLVDVLVRQEFTDEDRAVEHNARDAGGNVWPAASTLPTPVRCGKSHERKHRTVVPSHNRHAFPFLGI